MTKSLPRAPSHPAMHCYLRGNFVDRDEPHQMAAADVRKMAANDRVCIASGVFPSRKFLYVRVCGISLAHLSNDP